MNSILERRSGKENETKSTDGFATGSLSKIIRPAGDKEGRRISFGGTTAVRYVPGWKGIFTDRSQ